MTFTSPYDRVFVSYNRSDQASLRKIVDILRREGVDIVWDQDERAGNWSKWIETQIAAARLVCVCVKEECGAYQLSEEFPLVQRAMKNGCRVVPVLLRPKPTIPPWLDSEQHYFLNESYSEEDVREFARYIKQMLVAER
jgi:ketopantoate reductase